MMMRVIVHRLSIGLALGLGAAGLAWQSFSGDATPEADADRRLPELRVTLGASRKLVTTAGMSAADQAGFDRSGNFLKPHLLVLTLPDSRRIELTSRSTLVRLDGLEHDASRDEIVIELLVRRPVKPGRFQEVVADMLATIRSMGAEPHHDMITLTERGDIPGGEAVSGSPRVPINAKAVLIGKKRTRTRVHCEVRADAERGWFVLYTINSNSDFWPSAIRRREKQEFYDRRFARSMLSAQPLVPAAVQVEEMFPVTSHSFGRSRPKGEGSDLNDLLIAEAWFGDRYHLTLQVPIEFDSSLETVTRLRGEPTFVLQELEAITGENSFPGRLEPVWRSERRFDRAAWNKVVAAHGDFSAIGIDIDPTPVPRVADYIRHWRFETCQFSVLREARERAVRSAKPFLPVAAEIERMFPTADKEEPFPSTNHFLDTFVFTGKESDFQKTFITEAYFGERYQLMMRCDVELDKENRTVTRLRGEPIFTLREFGPGTGVIDKPTHVNWRREHRFTLDDWNKVVAAKGDFSAIGIEIDKSRVSDSDSEGTWRYVSYQNRFRDRVSLLDGAESGDEN